MFGALVTLMSTAACPPGRFGDTCELGMELIFGSHRIYDDFKPEDFMDPPRSASKEINAGEVSGGVKVYGWSAPLDVYERIIREAAESLWTASNSSLRLVVEVGVWQGLSALHLARALKAHTGGGALLAVDTWTGALEFWTGRGGFTRERNLHFRNGYPQVYYHFLSNAVRSGLAEFVVPFPVTSRLASDFFREKNIEWQRTGSSSRMMPDVVHLDAAHEENDVAEDIRLWWPLLRPGGILLGDDFSHHWPGLLRAVCAFATSQGLPLSVDTAKSKKWWIRKPSSPEALNRSHGLGPASRILLQRCTAPTRWLHAVANYSTSRGGDPCEPFQLGDVPAFTF